MKRADGIVVKFADKQAERDGAAAVAANFRNTAAMGGVWTRWEAWDVNPPIVAIEHGDVVGVHAAMFGKRNGYMNTYYLAVVPTHHRRGICGTMLGVGLVEAIRQGQTRLKMRAEEGLPGEFFWRKLGVVPLAIQRGDLIFDVDISELHRLNAVRKLGAEEATEMFAAWMKQPERHAPISDRAMQQWRRMKDIQFFDVALLDHARQEGVAW